MKSLMMTLAVVFTASTAFADPLTCNLTGYTAAPGLAAAVADDTLALTWDGDSNQELRLRLAINGGTPTIRDLSIRRKAARGTQPWATVLSNATPEYKVASGLRRATDQQIRPLRDLGIDITSTVIDEIKWEAFWDAPLNVPGANPAHGNSTPPLGGIAHQPGLPRRPSEVRRADAVFRAQNCEVKTNGARLEVIFPGVELGVFAGRLEYTVYKGTNLIKQNVVAKTEEKSVAYKYEAGLKGVALEPTSRMVWRDITNFWQDYSFGGPNNDTAVPLRAANRIAVAETGAGSIAAFPPPHRFFWAREVEVNLGYNYYRKDSDTSFAFGVRQAEGEDETTDMGRGAEDIRQNFALYSARPGTWQHMPVFFYVSADKGQPTLKSALAFTRDDRYKPLPGYQIMAQHFHTSPIPRAKAYGGLDVRIPDIDAMKAAGINVFGPVGPGGAGGFGGGDRSEARLQNLADYYEYARRHSDSSFLFMPNHEGGGAGIGGHIDFLLSKPLFWIEDRKPGDPLVEDHPKFGKVYHLGGPDDTIEMARRENILLFMPHARSKGSTGYPDAVKNKAHFRDEHYRGIGYRWGMGVDGSELRLCEYRCLDILDDMNNWVADVPTPPKFIEAITETYRRGPGDDIYANNPVSYVKLDRLPKVDDMSSIINTMKRGDYFVTSGEVLISSYAVTGGGTQRTVTADVEWTFPLEFAEVVWGDGQTTDRQIIPLTHLAPFGRHSFAIPFDATGKKWVRFALWDTAGNGALVQPIKLTTVTSTASR
jgi:hypothetical protein